MDIDIDMNFSVLILSLIITGNVTCFIDCNENDSNDQDDIVNGNSTDCNYNGVPDECEYWLNDEFWNISCKVFCNIEKDCNDNGHCLFGKCHCFPGINGDYCETVNHCYGINCDHGVCDQSNGICKCHQHYVGTNCNFIDCGINGIFDIHSKSCRCFGLYTGQFCDQCNIETPKVVNTTYVCCPVNNKRDYVLLAVSSDKLYNYLGGNMYSGQCIIPTSKNRHGIDLDCSCERLNHSESGMNGQVHAIKIDESTNRQMIANRFNKLNDPTFIGRMMDDLDDIITKRKFQAICTGPTGRTNSTGVALLIVLTIMTFLVASITIIWVIYTTGISKKTLVVKDESQNGKRKKERS